MAVLKNRYNVGVDSYSPYAQNPCTNTLQVLRSLEEALLDFAGCAMVVSHDRYFLDRIATHILACEGDSKWFFYPGNYADYEANRMERLGETSIKRITYAPLVNT